MLSRWLLPLSPSDLTDIIDLFENNLGKNNEDGKKFYKFMEGGRFGQIVAILFLFWH